MTRLAWSRSVSAVSVSLALSGCPSPAPNTTDEDPSTGTESSEGPPPGTTEPCEIGAEGCTCTGGGGCNPGLECNEAKICEPLAMTTVGPSSVDSETAETTDTSEDTTDATTESSTTVVLPDCEPNPDGESEECKDADPGHPFCNPSGVCVGCGDESLSGVLDCAAATGGDRPMCLASGACGQCDSPDALAMGQCSADAPHCDLDTNTCEGCFEHSECPNTACDIKFRTCFPEDQIVYVRQSECEDQIGTGGGPQDPYCDVNIAVASVLLGGAFTGWTFKILAGDSPTGHPAVYFPENIDNEVSYAIVHEFGGVLEPHTRFSGLGPLVVVTDNVNLYMVGFTIEVVGGFNASHLGIDCQEGGELWLDDSYVLHARGPGIRSTQCPVHLRRSSVSFGSTEGVEISDATLHMSNSFITANSWKAGEKGGGIHMHAGSVLDAVYSSLVDNANEKMTGFGDSVHCDGAVTINIRNSLLGRKPGTNNPSIVCDDGTVKVTNSLIDISLDKPNESMSSDNDKVAPEDIVTRLHANALNGSYKASGPLEAEYFEGRAVWRTGDPRDDFDREPRKIGTKFDLAGADVFINP